MYWKVTGIVAHILAVIILAILLTEFIGNCEVGRHEYAMCSIYSDQPFRGQRLMDTIKEAMSDKKITWNEWSLIEKVREQTEDEKYREQLLNNVSK